MRIMVVGDVHANIKLFSEIVNRTECDAVLQCGDIGIWSKEQFSRWGYLEDKAGHYHVYDTMAPITDVIESKIQFNKPVYFIIGNHEGFDLFDLMRANGDFNGKWNLTYISSSNPIKIDYIKVSGLSGCYSYKVYTGGSQKRRKIKVKPETPPEIEEYLNRVMGRDSRGRFTKNWVSSLRLLGGELFLVQ